MHDTKSEARNIISSAGEPVVGGHKDGEDEKAFGKEIQITTVVEVAYHDGDEDDLGRSPSMSDSEKTLAFP